jgi:hypothetical protein
MCQPAALSERTGQIRQHPPRLGQVEHHTVHEVCAVLVADDLACVANRAQQSQG